MAKVSKNVAKLYALKIYQGLITMDDVPAAYRTYVDIYLEQLRRGGNV